MRQRHVIMVAIAVAALTGCSSSPDKPATTAAAPASAASGAMASPSASIEPATLDATSAYLTALSKVDQRLVGNVQTALDNGQQVCVDIEERRSDAVQQKSIATRFAVNAEQAKQILALTKANLCLN